MKKSLLLILIGLSSQLVFGQNNGSTAAVKKDAEFSIRANWNYQYFSFSGRRTNSMALGGILEKRINYESTIGLTVNYITRMEDGSVQNENLPSYQEVVYFAPFVRKYFHKALDGPYAGFTMGIGIPSGKGTQWDFGGQFGYSILNHKLAVDLMINVGFGSYRYYTDAYNNNGIYVNEVFVRDYGFYFRPGISIGLAH
ncbi:MAG: hypothetical protein CL840_08235 [Crocinitomicaceae bacterium]|nr:hypothetical protein [Crocinitomicaceae bacterium]|tara:strand:- start:27018 stop:27611 length:594 start_codon:yes stop_codon:yes gene_type:complete